MNQDFTSHVRLSRSERSKLLCRLDAAPLLPRYSDRRREKRWDYRATDIAITVQHPGGGHGRFLVCPRNVSTGGLAFIHGGYVHPGSECRVVLKRWDGTPMVVDAVVAHCRHLQGSYHEVGVQFFHKIDPATIINPDEVARTGLTEHMYEMPELDGSVLVVDDSASDRRLLAHHLRATGLRFTSVDVPVKALELIQRGGFDIVLTDLTFGKADGVRMIELMREYQFRGAIIVVTAETDLKRLAGARGAGANEVVGKPYDPGYLMSLLAEWLEAPAVDRPIYSRLEEKPGMAELILEFIDQVQQMARDLEKAMADYEYESVRALVLELMGSGTGYGFEPITAAARDTLSALEASDSLEESVAQLQRLISICGRLRCCRASRPIGPAGPMLAD